MTEHINTEIGQIAWDSTSLGAFLTCPEYYHLRIIEGWQTPTESVHLRFGQHYATALEHYYKHRAEGDDDLTATVKVVREALIATWEYGYRTPEDATAKRNPLPGTGYPWVSGHTTKTRENLIRTIIWYLDQFGDNDPCEVVTLADGSPAVELSFRFEIDAGLLWCGHLDRLVRYGDDSYVMDQKTTGSTIGPYWFDQWKTEGQFLGYALAGQVVFDTPVRGVIVDGAQIAVGFSRFERGFINFTEAQLNEWADEAVEWMRTAQQAYRDQQWLRNRKSCNNYGGCPFRSVCATDPRHRRQFLKADFVRRPVWNPLETR